MHVGVDTVRQHYRGFVWADVLDIVARRDDCIELAGHTWALGRLGKASGYRYRLQNNELGLICLLGSYFARLDALGAHLKIEASPHWLAERTSVQAQTELDAIAAVLLRSPEPAGIAVHLAVDVQGWEPVPDFSERFVTRARVMSDRSGISDVELSLSDVAVRYGKGQSWTFGKANATQLAVYRKDLEAVSRDKIDYWRSVWDRYALVMHDADAPVYRIEARLHHSVVGDLGRSVAADWQTYAAIAGHLRELWRYALTNNRLDTAAGVIDPYWQRFLEDPEFVAGGATGLRRKKKDAVDPIARNVANLLGNLISLFARRGVRSPDRILQQVRGLDCWDEIRDYYRERGKGLAELREHIGKALALRFLIGKAA